MKVQDKLNAARVAFERYDLQFNGSRPRTFSIWEISDPLKYTRRVYFDQPKQRVKFTVTFSETDGKLISASAVDMDPAEKTEGSGSALLYHDVFLHTAAGITFYKVRVDDRTHWMVVHNVEAALKAISAVNGVIVDFTTDFDSILNSEFNGFAVLSQPE